MRISDWSSDVCSSDLPCRVQSLDDRCAVGRELGSRDPPKPLIKPWCGGRFCHRLPPKSSRNWVEWRNAIKKFPPWGIRLFFGKKSQRQKRTEARRVGTKSVSTGRARV